MCMYVFSPTCNYVYPSCFPFNLVFFIHYTVIAAVKGQTRNSKSSCMKEKFSKLKNYLLCSTLFPPLPLYLELKAVALPVTQLLSQSKLI